MNQGNMVRILWNLNFRMDYRIPLYPGTQPLGTVWPSLTQKDLPACTVPL